MNICSIHMIEDLNESVKKMRSETLNIYDKVFLLDRETYFKLENKDTLNNVNYIIIENPKLNGRILVVDKEYADMILHIGKDVPSMELKQIEANGEPRNRAERRAEMKRKRKLVK